MFALNPLGLEGSVLQMINHGLSTGGLFLIVGLLYERRHTKEISQFGGLAHVMPVYATFTLIIFLASMGLPLLNGFIGEFMILQARLRREPHLGVLGGPRASCSAPPTCSGSTSACSGARSRTRRTSTSRT